MDARSDGLSFADIVDLHLSDMDEMGRILGRSKSAVLKSLRRDLGGFKLRDLTRPALISYGKSRAKSGAGPATLTVDLSFIGTLLNDAAAIHGIEVSTEQVKLARVALTRLGLVGKPNERTRRPSEEELDSLIAYFATNHRQVIPMHRIIAFAVATAMRIQEICSIRWEDLEEQNKMVTIRDRKDPRNKIGNHQRIPLLNLTGFDAWELVNEQRKVTEGQARIFPYNHRSAGTAFRVACTSLQIEDLHFHDLRHEAASRLFEAGLTIEKVALVTGHKDWKMLRRYTNLKPESLHQIQR